MRGESAQKHINVACYLWVELIGEESSVRSRVMHNVSSFNCLGAFCWCFFFGWHAMLNAWILHNIVDGNNDDFLGVFSLKTIADQLCIFILFLLRPKRWGYLKKKCVFFLANCFIYCYTVFIPGLIFQEIFYICQYSLQWSNCFSISGCKEILR